MARRRQKRGGDSSKLLDECLTACLGISHFLESDKPIGKLTPTARHQLLADLKHLGSELVRQIMLAEPETYVELPNGKWMLRKHYKASVVPLTPPKSLNANVPCGGVITSASAEADGRKTKALMKSRPPRGIRPTIFGPISDAVA
jgi:hypothetical protein